MGNGSSSQESDAVSSLTALGFDAGEAQAALRETHGSVERAAELLFQRRGGPTQAAPAPIPAPAPAAAPARATSSYESDMERAMRESREQARVDAARAAEQRRRQQQQQQKRRQQQHSQGRGAAGAATSATPRDVRVRAAAASLESSPRALDVLLRMLSQLLQDPHNRKYRTVSLTNKAFAAVVAPADGALELLRAVGFEPVATLGGASEGMSGTHSSLSLRDSHLDIGLLWLAKGLLEQAQSGSGAYARAREGEDLEAAISASADDFAARERARKAALRRRLPPEPEQGGAGVALVTVALGDAAASGSAAGAEGKTALVRRFEADHTLQQVVTFVNSAEGVSGQVYRDWQLVDHGQFPPRVLVEADAGKTLQSLGLWPVGQLRLLPPGADAAQSVQPVQPLGFDGRQG